MGMGRTRWLVVGFGRSILDPRRDRRERLRARGMPRGRCQIGGPNGMSVELPTLRREEPRRLKGPRGVKCSQQKDLRQYTRQGSNLQPSVP